MEAVLTEHTWRLSDPGMDLLERAGLAGLNMALKAAGEAGHDLSPLQWTDADLTADSVTVRWSGPANVAFQKLIEWAWQVKDGVLFFPAVHRGLSEANWHLRVPMHNGIMRTFLQHTNVQPKGTPATRVIQLGEDKQVAITFPPPIIRPPDPGEEPRALLAPWADFCKLFRSGRMSDVTAKPITWITPGMAGRFGKETNWRGRTDRALLLMLAPTICLYLKLPKTKIIIKGASKWVDNWAVVAPDVRHLADFAAKRHRLHLATDFVDAASLGDAGLRFLAEFSTGEARRDMRAGCRVIAMGYVTYYANQSVRKSLLDVPLKTTSVRRYRRLHEVFPNHFQRRKADAPPDATKKPRGKKKPPPPTEALQGNGWYKVPTGRGRIADNLVSELPWYRDLFVPLPWDEKELEDLRQFFKTRDKRSYSRETTWFHALCLQRSNLMRLIAEDDMWDTEAEQIFIQVFWETLDSLYAQEAAATQRGGSRTAADRFEHLNDEIRRNLMQAKTRPLLRAVLTGLFAKAGRQRCIAAHTAAVWRLIDHPEHWQKGRDLALLGLASHRNRAVREGKDADMETTNLDIKEPQS